MIHDFRLQLPASWPERVLEFVDTLPPVTHAVPADVVRQHLPELGAAYQMAADDIGRLFNAPVRIRDDRQFGSLNINVFHGAGAECPWHRDDNTFTVLAYPHKIGAFDGGALRVRMNDQVIVLCPERGQTIAFMGSALEHAVDPLKGGRRVSVLMAFQHRDIPDIPPNDHLHVRGMY